MRIDTNVLSMIARQSLYGNKQCMNIMDFFASSKICILIRIVSQVNTILLYRCVLKNIPIQKQKGNTYKLCTSLLFCTQYFYGATVITCPLRSILIFIFPSCALYNPSLCNSILQSCTKVGNLRI